MANTSLYVLEVLQILDDGDGEDGWKKQGGKFKHIGYMKGKFKKKKDAVSYYDRHNPHLRSLNAHNNYKSDWDPETKLFYIVRDDYGIIATIDCFDVNDNPVRVEHANGSVSTTYDYLK